MPPLLRYLTIGAGIVACYALGGWLLAGQPVWRSSLGHLLLVASAAFAPIVVWRRRREWAGCQRLFWFTLALGMVFWILGHAGWAIDDLVLGQPSWLRWHTVFSLCAGIAPLVALLARPHLGVRSAAVPAAALDIAAYGLLVVFIYVDFVLAESVIPGLHADAQTRLLTLVQINRFALLLGLLAALRFARGSAWQSTYGRLVAGVAVGFVLRIGTSLAIARGEYQPGTIHDLAWIIPWLFYAWAAFEAPSSGPHDAFAAPPDSWPLVVSVVPVLLIPAIGYGGLYLDAGGTAADPFRILLTGVTTVCGVVLLTVRLATQGGELQRADERLKLLAAATEQTGDLILITRADGTFEHANLAFLRALGYSRRELALMGFSELIDGQSQRLGAQIPADVRRYGIWRGTLNRRRKDGSTFPASCTVAALKDASGGITHFVGVERDISDELRLRDQLVQSERLSAIGELVAGVAHEINNPLQTIVGTVELMLDEAPDVVNRRDLELVRREGTRAGQIVRNLLSFIRRGAPDRIRVDLTHIVKTTVDLREYHLRQNNIAVDLRCAPEPLPVLVNRDEIQQVVLNLLLNAEQAIVSHSGSGTITVVTGGDGVHQQVDVMDTGPGISAELRGRIFEPFFTTKDVGAGTGLGLSISHGIAGAHGGALELVPTDAGAHFRLTLPAHVERRALPPDLGPVGVRRALIVDDEAAIRRLMSRLLVRRGFEVLEAATGEAALVMGESEPLSLVICDVRMPGIDGLEFYRRLAARHPLLGRRFIFITGDATSLESVESQRDNLPVLPKPFTAADLDAILARMGVEASSG